MSHLLRYINDKENYQIVIKRTGKILEKFRLKASANHRLRELQRDYEEELEIKYVIPD